MSVVAIYKWRPVVFLVVSLQDLTAVLTLTQCTVLSPLQTSTAVFNYNHKYGKFSELELTKHI